MVLQFQYPAKSEPVFVEEVSDALTWMASQPAGIFGGEQTQYQFKTEPVFVVAVAPEDITLDKWFQPASQPVPDVEQNTEEFGESAPVQEPELVTLDKWFQPVSQPIFVIPEATSVEIVSPLETPAAVEDVTLDKWLQDYSQPTPDVERDTVSTGSFKPDQEPELVTVDKWFQPASQPIFVLPDATSVEIVSPVEPPVAAEDVTVDKWLHDYSQPTPDVELDTVSTGSFHPDQEPELVTVDKWQQPFSQPVDELPVLTTPTGLFEPFVVEAPAPTLDSWFVQAGVPQLEVEETLRADWYYAPKDTPVIAPAPSMDSWSQPTNQWLLQPDEVPPDLPFSFSVLDDSTFATSVPANLKLSNEFSFCLAVGAELAFDILTSKDCTYELAVAHRNLMGTNRIDIGDQVRLRGVFTDPNNGDAAIDPTTITIRYQDPSGNITSKTYVTDAEVIKESTGIYYMDVTIDESGQWTYKILGTGAAVAAEENGFAVHEEKTPSV